MSDEDNNVADTSESNIAEETLELTIEGLQDELAELKTKHTELADSYLRKQADFDNYRKRMLKEKTESIQFANADLIESMLDVLDNFARAEKAAEDSHDVDTLKQGITMIKSNLETVLNSRGLQKMPSVGTPFDPSLHQALAMEEDDTVKEATVAEEFQAGYKLHDRIIRSAKVRVLMPKNSKSTDSVH